MMDMDRAHANSEFRGELAQQVQQHDGIDSAGKAHGNAFAPQVVRAQESAHRAFSARRFP